MLKKSLPGSQFVGDSETTGYVSVTVSRRDVYNLPRFFAWLESSPDAIAMVREWGVSNTTLEQVFLMLCKSSTDVNYVDHREEEDSMLCPMCRSRPKETVMVRNIPGQIFLLPDAACAVCTVANKNYFVSEDEFSRLQALPYPSIPFAEEMDKLLAAARDKATIEFLEQMHFSTSTIPKHTAALSIEPMDNDAESDSERADITTENNDRNCEDYSSKDNEKITAENPEYTPVEATDTEGNIAASSVVKHENNEHRDKASGVQTNPHALVISTVRSQITAVLIKNARLQSYQRCSNICGLLFVGIMFLFLYVFSLLFVGADSIRQCNGGYIVLGGEKCNLESAINHIFAGICNVCDS